MLQQSEGGIGKSRWSREILPLKISLGGWIFHSFIISREGLILTLTIERLMMIECPFSTKTREVLGNPSPPASRFLSTLEISLGLRHGKSLGLRERFFAFDFTRRSSIPFKPRIQDFSQHLCKDDLCVQYKFSHQSKKYKI